MSGNWLIFLASAPLLASQLFNRWPGPKGRIGLVCGAAMLLYSGLALDGEFGAAVFMLVCVAIIISTKWFYEIDEDQDARKEAGLPPLLKDRLGVFSIIGPTFSFRYRKRMFQDSWSRQNILTQSMSMGREGMAPREGERD